MSETLSDFFVGPAWLVLVAVAAAAAALGLRLRTLARQRLQRLHDARGELRELRNIQGGPVALVGKWRPLEGGGVLEEGAQRVRVRGGALPAGEATVVGIAAPDVEADAVLPPDAYRQGGGAWVITLGDGGFVAAGRDGLQRTIAAAQRRALSGALVLLGALFVGALVTGLHFAALR